MSMMNGQTNMKFPLRKLKRDFMKLVHSFVYSQSTNELITQGKSVQLWGSPVAVMLCVEWFLGSRNLSIQRYRGGLRPEGTWSLPGGTNHQLARRISDKRAVIPEMFVPVEWQRKIGPVANVLIWLREWH